jgi:hypothetical protein
VVEDTVKARERTIRLVGFDAAETGLNARCARERELDERATARLRSLVAGGSLELRMMPCACRLGAEGMRECNYGRSCGYLTAYGRDVGTRMIKWWRGRTLAAPRHAPRVGRGVDGCRCSGSCMRLTANNGFSFKKRTL